MSKTIEVKLTDWGYGPAPFGRIPAANGKSQLVFVVGTLDGDTVQAQVAGASGTALWARPAIYLTSAPERQKRTCAGVGKCACSFQHITYAKQLEIKRNVLQNHLERFGPSDFPAPIIIETAAPDNLQRNRIHLQPDEDRKLRVPAPHMELAETFGGCNHISESLQSLLTQIQFGEEEEDVTSIDISINAQDDILFAIRTASGLIPEIGFDLALNAAFLKPDGSYVPLSGNAYLWQALGDRVLMIPAGAPYPEWDVAALVLCNALNKKIQTSTSLLTINAGSAWLLASLDAVEKRNVVIETNDAFVEAIATNLDHLKDADLYQDAVPAALDHLKSTKTSFETVLFQSAGRKIDAAVAKQLKRVTAQQLILIGNTPISMAKDLAALAQQGFTITEIALADTEPYTHRSTFVATLTRNH